MSHHLEYARIGQSAVDAFHRGEHRRSADHYLEATLKAPSVWSENRYQLFTGYTSILTEKYFAPPDDNADLKALQRFKGDKSEPHLFRTEAAFTLALLHWNAGERTVAAEAYRSVLRIGRKAKERERNKTVVSMNGVDPRNMMAADPMKKVGDLIDYTLQKAQENLANLESPFSSRPSSPPLKIRSDGSAMPPSARRTLIPMGPRAAALSDQECGHLLSVGGGECDHCKKTLKELGLHHLKQCSVCQKAFYCSADCQGRQWKAGHKGACRTAGQMEPGDYARVEGLVRKPELNGTMVQIIGPVPDRPGRLEVRIHGGTTSLGVAKEKLQQLRPLK